MLSQGYLQVSCFRKQEKQAQYEFENPIKVNNQLENNNTVQMVSSSIDSQETGKLIYNPLIYLAKKGKDILFDKLADEIEDKLMEHIFNPIIDKSVSTAKNKLLLYLQTNPQHLDSVTKRIKKEIAKHPKYEEKGSKILTLIQNQANDIIHQRMSKDKRDYINLETLLSLMDVKEAEEKLKKIKTESLPLYKIYVKYKKIKEFETKYLLSSKDYKKVKETKEQKPKTANKDI